MYPDSAYRCEPGLKSLFTTRESTRLTLAAASARFTGAPGIQGDIAADMQAPRASYQRLALPQGLLKFIPGFQTHLQNEISKRVLVSFPHRPE